MLCPNFDETLTPTGGTTYSALDGVVIRHLLRLRLTSAGSSRRLSALGSTTAKLQISQGNSLDLLGYAFRIYVTAFRASIGLWRLLQPYPAVPPHPLPVRQASILPRASLSFAVTRAPPCLWLTLPPCRVCRELPPPSHQRGYRIANWLRLRATRHAWRTIKTSAWLRLVFLI